VSSSIFGRVKYSRSFAEKSRIDVTPVRPSGTNGEDSRIPHRHPTTLARNYIRWNGCRVRAGTPLVNIGKSSVALCSFRIPIALSRGISSGIRFMSESRRSGRRRQYQKFRHFGVDGPENRRQTVTFPTTRRVYAAWFPNRFSRIDWREIDEMQQINHGQVSATGPIRTRSRPCKSVSRAVSNVQFDTCDAKRARCAVRPSKRFRDPRRIGDREIEF